MTNTFLKCYRILASSSIYPANSWRKKNDSDENVALTVHVHAWNQAGIKIPKVAVLWYPGAHNEVDLISPKLVAEVLCLEIQTSGKRRKGLPWGTRGHVEVEWGLENSDTTRCTRFMVVSMYDPPFDLLLGKTTALECGLTRE